MSTVTFNILATADDQAKQQEEHRRAQLLKEKQRNCKHAFIGRIGPMLKITELQCAHCGLSKSEAEKQASVPVEYNWAHDPKTLPAAQDMGKAFGWKLRKGNVVIYAQSLGFFAKGYDIIDFKTGKIIGKVL